MRIAFFDLDKTLICRNSATLWIRFELAAGRITMREAFEALAWVLRYSIGATNIVPALRRAVAALTGQREQDMRRRVETFHQSMVRPLYRPGAREAIERHRDAGDHLVLLTSASNYVSELVCDDLELDGYVCSRFEVDSHGVYTGRPVEPLCFGEGKVELAGRYASTLDLGLESSAFYSDSHSDLPMLEAAGEPMVVNPDPRLRRLARKRGWSILDWGSP